MVRLKDDVVVLHQAVVAFFQFHYGTIKSKFIPESCFGLSSFQFHYGTIKR